MHPDKNYIDLTAKGKRNLALATKQFGSFYELVSRPKQKKFLGMLADPTLSGPLRRATKATGNFVIPEGMTVVYEKNIQDMLSDFGDGLHKRILASLETLTSNQVPQADDLEPPLVVDDEMVDPTPDSEPLPDVNPEDSLNDEGPTDAPYLNHPVPDVEMTDANEVEDSLPLIDGPEEIPLTIEQARAEIERLQRRIDEIEAEFEQTKENLGRLEAKNLELGEQNANLVEKAAELTGSVAKLTEQVLQLTQQDVKLLDQHKALLNENGRLKVDLRNVKSKLCTLKRLQAHITDFHNDEDDEDDQLRSSSSVRDSGVGLPPIKNAPTSTPPPSSP